MKKKNSIFKMKDRKLGDEWIGWQGNMETFERDTNTGKRIFMGVLLSTIFMAGIVSFIIWYLITPRLSQFHPYLPLAVGIVAIFAWMVLATWFILMVLCIWTEKDIFMKLGGKEFSITFLIPLVLKFGLKLGISRDRMSNSFVKVSNTLIRTTARRVKPEKLLILLPRCLKNSLRERITDFSRQLKVPVYTVAGGERARQVVYQINPMAIIGVACERDLLSGIQDVIKKIPVIGIPNVRPEGPCKNTIIDFSEFERAVQTFLGPDIHYILPKNS